MKRKTFIKAVVSLIMIVSIALSTVTVLPASAASSGWSCATPKINSASIHQRGQSIGFRWNAVKGASRYRVFYKVSGGSWKKIGDYRGTLFYDSDLNRTCKGAYYTVRCLSDDGSRYLSDYVHSGTWLKASYYSTPNLEHIKTVNWNKAYLFFEANTNVIEDGGKFQLYMKKGKNGSWTRITSTLMTWDRTPEVRSDYDGRKYYPICYRAEITDDSVPYPGETYYYTVRSIGYGNKPIDGGRVGYGEIFTSMYNDNNKWYIYHGK